MTTPEPEGGESVSDVDPRVAAIPEQRRAVTPGGECVHAIEKDMPAMSVLQRRVKLMCGKITSPSAPDRQSRICENCYSKMVKTGQLEEATHDPT